MVDIKFIEVRKEGKKKERKRRMKEERKEGRSILVILASLRKSVRTSHGTMDWFQTGKGVHQGCILSQC